MALPYICQNISKSPTTVKFSEKSRNKHRFNHFQGCPLSRLCLYSNWFFSVLSTCINDQIQKCITKNNKQVKALEIYTQSVCSNCISMMHFQLYFTQYRHLPQKILYKCISIEACIMINKEAYVMENIYCFKGFSLHFQLDIYGHLCTHIRCFIIYLFMYILFLIQL